MHPAHWRPHKKPGTIAEYACMPTAPKFSTPADAEMPDQAASIISVSILAHPCMKSGAHHFLFPSCVDFLLHTPRKKSLWSSTDFFPSKFCQYRIRAGSQASHAPRSATMSLDRISLQKSMLNSVHANRKTRKK